MQSECPILIDAYEAGRLLDMLPARVTRFAKRGELPAVILPDGELRFHEADLLAWVDRFRKPVEGVENGNNEPKP